MTIALILLATLFLLSLSFAQNTFESQKVILSEGQSAQISLLPFISDSNTSFSLPDDAPEYASITNSLPSIQSINITGIPEDYVSAAIDAVYQKFVFIDQSLTLYNGSYQNGAIVNVSSMRIPATDNSTCSSVVHVNGMSLFYFDFYFAVVCGYLNSSGQQVENLFIFSFEFGFEVQRPVLVLPYDSLQTLLIPKVTVSPEFQTIMLYFDYNTLQGRTPIICFFDVFSSGGYWEYFTNIDPFLVQKVQAVDNDLLIFDTTGGIFSFYWNYLSKIQDVIDPATYLGNLTDIVLGSCAAQQRIEDPLVMAFSQTKLYYIEDPVLGQTYSIPNGYTPILCSFDYTNEYMFLITQNSQDNSTYAFVYLLSDTINGNILTEMLLPISAEDVLTASPSQVPGQLALLSSDEILIITIQKPFLKLQNIQGSNSFNVSIENSRDIIPINVTSLSDVTKIYQKQSSMGGIALSNSNINIQDLLIGPSVGYLTDNNTFFNGVYGPCSISNFSTLLNQSTSNFVFARSMTSNSNNFSATFIYLYDTILEYVDISFNNPYSTGDWNSVQSCNQTMNVLATHTVNLTSLPTQCSFGQNKDSCLVNDSTAFISNYSVYGGYTDCQNSNSTIFMLPGDQFVCIASDFFSLIDQFDSVQLYSASRFGVESFLPFLSLYQYPSSSSSLLVIAHTQGLVGINLVFLGYFLAFNIQVDFSKNNSFVQVTAERLVLVDFDANTITEWDISDLYNPFMVGQYSLFSFKLDPTFTPTYYPIPNHLIFSSFNGSTQYILVFQPGNVATSTLLYAINLSDFINPNEIEEITGTNILKISSLYYDFYQYTSPLVLTPSSLVYFYTPSSVLIPLTSLQQTETACLYCPETSLVQISSNILPDSAFNFSISYVKVSSEQPIISQNNTPSFDVDNQNTLYIIPNNSFQGTPLDYSLSNLTFNNQSVLYMNTPLSFSQLLLAHSNSYTDPPPQITLFSNNQDRLYILYQDQAWFVSLPTTPLQIQNITIEPRPDYSFNFSSGDSSTLQNTTLFVAAHDWVSPGKSTILYNPFTGGSLDFNDRIIKIKMINDLSFALMQPGFQLLYVLNTTQNSFNIIATAKSDFFYLNPLDFAVVNLNGDLYAITIVDGSDTIYSVMLDIKSGVAQSQMFTNFTGKVQTDLPPETLPIIQIQSNNLNAQNQIYTVDYILYVTNFHSYQIQIIYDQEAQLGDIIRCFVQMPDHVSIGKATTTDFYFLDIKKSNDFYYLYSYPLDLAYNSNSQQPGSYSYIKPIQRQLINSSSNSFSLCALNGENSLAFVGTPMGDVNVAVYSLRNALEIGFNPSLTSDEISGFNLAQVNLTASNNISQSTIQLTLHYYPRSFVDSWYFIAIMVVLGVIVIGLCIWIWKKWNKRRKARVTQKSDDYQVLRASLET